jgi:hypothetical protein
VLFRLLLLTSHVASFFASEVADSASVHTHSSTARWGTDCSFHHLQPYFMPDGFVQCFLLSRRTRSFKFRFLIASLSPVRVLRCLFSTVSPCAVQNNGAHLWPRIRYFSCRRRLAAWCRYPYRSSSAPVFTTAPSLRTS